MIYEKTEEISIYSKKNINLDRRNNYVVGF